MLLNVVVPAYNVGFVKKRGKFLKIINEGTYWWIDGDQVDFVSMDKPLTVPPFELEVYLADPEVAAALLIIDVPSNHIGLLYERGLFKSVLQAGRYTYWKGFIEYTCTLVDISQYVISGSIDRILLSKTELQPYLRAYNVESYEKGVLFVDGKRDRDLAPGFYQFWKNPTVLTVFKTDIRQVQMEINGQEILTRDKAALRLNCTLQYRVVDTDKAMENKEYDRQLYVLVQMALREQVASYSFDELLERRDSISANVIDLVKEKAAQLGVQINSCGIRDIILPGDMKDIMNQVLIAEKKAQANVIMRREETSSTRSLLNTAKLMEENSMLLKLKEMEYIEKIADKINSLSLSGGTDLVNQLKQIFVPAK